MIQWQILRTNIKRIVWKKVRRFIDEIFGVKGLKEIRVHGHNVCGNFFTYSGDVWMEITHLNSFQVKEKWIDWYQY